VAAPPTTKMATTSTLFQLELLHLLQWAWAHGCSWDDSTCASAAVAGHLEVVQWAREHGCPWSKRVSVPSTTRRLWRGCRSSR